PDVSAETRAVKASQERAEHSNLILRLIEDEFETIRSLDESSAHSGPSTPGTAPGSGADPLYDPSAPLRLDEFDRSNEPTPSPFGGSRLEPTPVPHPHSAPFSLHTPAQRPGSAPYPAADSGPMDLGLPRRNPLPWLVAALALVLAGIVYMLL